MICGRPAKLSAAQVAELRQRYALYRANRPKVVAREFGLTDTMFHRYATGKVKRYG